MNIKQLEKEIIKAVNTEINMASNVGINKDTYYDANVELLYLKRFIKKCFKEYKMEG